MMTSDAICRVTPVPTNGPNLVWLPHAGGGTAPIFREYRMQMAPSPRPRGAATVASGVAACDANSGPNLWAVRLPGRESRFGEPFAADIDSLVDSLATDLAAILPVNGLPTVLMGHSLGGLIAYRLAAKLLNTKLVRVDGLVVMGVSPPDQWTQRREWLDWDDDAFANELDRRYGGMPAGWKDHPEAMATFLPIVRSDLRLSETYQHVEATRLPLPILALAGTEDRVADRAKMMGWQHYAGGGFSLRTMPGGHFFPLKQFRRVLKVVEGMHGEIGKR